MKRPDLRSSQWHSQTARTNFVRFAFSAGSSWQWRGLSLLVLMIAWQLLAMVAHSDLLPSFFGVLEQLYLYILSGELPLALLITTARVAAGFAIAMAVGTALGFLMGRIRKLDLFLDSALVIGLNIPALVLIILCYLWFGLTETAAILAVMANMIPVIVVNVREGARAIDLRLLAVAEAYRVPRLVTFRKVILPQLYPYLVASARTGLSLIWKIVLIVELLGRSSGVGFRLSLYFQYFDITSILAYTVAFAILVLVIEASLLRPLERRLTRWRT